MSRTSFHAHELYRRMFYLSTRDVLCCMKVCKYWKTALSDERFWKDLINTKFDLSINTQLLEGPMKQWGTSDWVCYFGGWEDDDDYYHPMRPLPLTWNCGVVVPSGLEVSSLDLRHLQGLCRSLEILTRIREAKEKFGYRCGYECSSNESGAGHDIAVVLIPWDKEGIPDKRTLFRDIFHFHHAIWQDDLPYNNNESEEQLLFHVKTGDTHRDKSKPCLNSTFGRYNVESSLTLDREKEIEFCSWLQKIIVPSRRYRAGNLKLNPVVHFLITTLGPGWVGGALTGETWT